ncbi:MAG: hypothetical protein HY647_10550, partial [Acidobacteria bacterium]|nr:hypothetical protein [Acidobacteriota bacterium]
MAEEPSTGEQKPRPRKRWLRWSWAGLALVCALGLGAAAFLQSSLFQEMVRRRLVAVLEQTTGGRVELREFAFYPSRLEVHLRGLVLHGREGNQEPPFFSAEEVQADWRILSVWGLRADLARLRLWEPRIYIAAYEDGRTNLPAFPLKSPGDGSWAARVLALRIGHLELLRGQFRWNENPLPLEFQAENFRLGLQYEATEQRYSGRADFQKATLVSPKDVSLSIQGQVDFRLSSNGIEIENLVWQTPKSRFLAQGALEDFRSPRIHFRHQLQLDWKEIAGVWGRSGWEGDLTWQGQGKLDEQGWEVTGDLKARLVEMGVAALREVPWSAHSTLRVLRPAHARESGESASWRAEFSGLKVAALGGQFGGSAVVDGVWPSPKVRLDLLAQR